MSWWDGSGEMPQIEQQVLSTPETTWNWDFPQAEFGPIFEWGNQGGLGQTPIGGFNGFNVAPSPIMQPPSSFSPAMAPASSPAMAPAPVPMGASAPSPASPVSAATSPLGGAPGSDTDSKSLPRMGGGATGAPAMSGWQPGSQNTNMPAPGADHKHAAPPPNPTTPGDNQGGFDWKKMLGGLGGNIASSGTQALIGGGLSLLGQKLAPKEGGKSSSPAAAAPAPAAEAPAPQTPTGTPNMGTTAPLPGANWSPLLMKKPALPVGGAASAGLDVEAQKRMRRGGQTGGMALY